MDYTTDWYKFDLHVSVFIQQIIGYSLGVEMLRWLFPFSQPPLSMLIDAVIA